MIIAAIDELILVLKKHFKYGGFDHRQRSISSPYKEIIFFLEGEWIGVDFSLKAGGIDGDG